MIGIIYCSNGYPELLAAGNDDELDELKNVFLEEFRSHNMSDFFDIDCVESCITDATLEDIKQDFVKCTIPHDAPKPACIRMQYLPAVLE